MSQELSSEQAAFVEAVESMGYDVEMYKTWGYNPEAPAVRVEGQGELMELLKALVEEDLDIYQIRFDGVGGDNLIVYHK
jgi:hypothetical protein